MPGVVVVGAGIAGLAAGLALRRAGAAVEVVERADGPDRSGAGLYLPGNATRALRRLGLDLDGLGGAVISRQRFCDHRGRVLADVDLASVWDGCGPCLGVPRAALHRALLDVAGVPVTFGVTATGLARSPGGVAVELSDGSRREAELLVGADGLRSTVRGLLGDATPPHPLGQRSWRFVVEQPGVDAWTVLLGRGRTFLLVPVGGHRVYCYADVAMAGADGPADLRELFAGFAHPVPAVLAHPEAGSAHVAPIAEVRAAPPASGRIVLIGDAAHATSPNMAQGAAMAVEDALVLAEEGAARPLSEALAAFAARRAPRTSWVREQTHRRDRTRGLPPPVRNAVLRLAGERIYRANYRPLLAEP